MPGMPVRGLRTPSFAARSNRSRHHRRRLLAVLTGAPIVALSLLVSGPAPAVRADDPPEYHAIALGLVTDTNYVTVINESGSMGGYTRDNRLARIEGKTVTPLSNVQNGYLSSISDDGTMVGYQNDRAIRVDGTTITPLPGLGNTFGFAAAIDRAATRIVGYSQVDSDQVGWVLEGGTTTPLPGLGGTYTSSYPSKINSSGLIAGTASNPNTGEARFVTWQNGVINDLGDLGGQSLSVYDLNDAGQVVVVYYVPGGDSHAAVLDGSSATDLGTLGGQSTYAQDINNLGQIAMTSSDPAGHSHALLWENGSFQDLGNLGGTDSNANAINDHGQVTGGYNTADGKSHGFLYDDGTMYDLNALLPPHSVQITGGATITDSGYILAYSDAGSVLLVPGPAPAAAYDIIDLDTASLGSSFDVGPIDMNSARHVIGAYDHGAFQYDGSTTSMLLDPFQGGVSAISENGVIVGTAQHNGQAEAFSYDGTFHFLGTMGGQSFGYDVNDAGDVVGTAADGGGVNHAFLYRGGTFAPLPVPGGTASEARRVNAAGTAIGFYWTGSYNGQDAHAFMSDGTTSTDLGTLGGTVTIPQAINDAGEIVGQSRTASKDFVAFWYHGGTMEPIDPAGSTMGWTIDINESGQILASYRDSSGIDNAYIYDHGTSTPIPSMGSGSTYSTDISNRGQVVGSGNTGGSGFASHAFLFDDGDLIDLNDAVTSGYEAVIDYAVKVNDDGTILAGSTGAGHKRHVILLVPTTPLPPLPPPPVHATPAHPTVATVTSPNPGAVTVTEAATNDAPPVGSGYTFLGHQLNITAPASDPAHPISIVVKVDASLLASTDPDLTAADVAVFRNGVLVAGCAPTGGDDPATPDPCVSDRTTLSGGSDAGDARITILTSTASHWNVGFVATAPGAPTGATAVRGDKQATVSWTAPANTGHSPITGYTVTSTPGNKTATVPGSASSAIVLGLTNGTSYTFTVKAANAVGPSPASAPSNAVTPGTLQNQSITFAKPANQVLTTPSITVQPTASSGLPVTLTSSSPAVCTTSGFTISLLTAGTCSVTASQAGDGTYKPASQLRTFTVSQVVQTITFVKPAPQFLNNPTLTVNPTSTGPLPITLASTSPTVCTVTGFDVSLVGVGTCSLTASQAGNTVYSTATPVTRTFAVSQATQTITFVKPAPQLMTTPSITVAPTASSGLGVTLTSTSPSICSVNGFDINLLAAGTCAVTASQAGDFAWKAATSVPRTFAISKAAQTITIPDPGPQSLSVHTVTLAPTASSGLAVTLVTQTASVCTVIGNTVTLLKVGTCKVKGTQAGDPIYLPATAVVRQFNVTS